MRKKYKTDHDMPGVMVFAANESAQETERKWQKWLADNKGSHIQDKAEPSLEALWKMLDDITFEPEETRENFLHLEWEFYDI